MKNTNSEPIVKTWFQAASEVLPSLVTFPRDPENDSYLQLLDFLAGRNPVEIALDTEYQGPHTLTIQAATRIGQEIVVQVYRSLDVPPPPPSFNLTKYLPQQQYKNFFRNVTLRPIRTITDDLSPAEILLDLFRISGLPTDDRHQGSRFIRRVTGHVCELLNAEWDETRGTWKIPTIRLRLIGHFLTADLGRIFGANFFKSLFSTSAAADQQHALPLTIASHKVLKLADPGSGFVQPTVEYLHSLHGHLYRITLDTRDTMFPFGPASLERHSKTFLGFGKSQAISDEDKSRMIEVFWKRPDDAYGYAGVDAVNTLLVHEGMEAAHEQIYERFDMGDRTPPFQPSMGSRVSQFLMDKFVRQCEGSQYLPSPKEVKQLMRRGGRCLFDEDPRASHFGPQTGSTHGGLLFTRSPMRFWHEAVGQFRDVDMSSCYSRIVSRLNMYAGRPVIHEPGDNRMSLKEAVTWARKHADDDAWMIRVTGDLPSGVNSLIPSTLEATTAESLKRRHRSKGRAQHKSARLFSHRIESGIVTHATWTVIQSLPKALRAEYQALDAESIVLYPREFVAGTPQEFDRLTEQRRHGQLGWDGTVDFRKKLIIENTRLDDTYVAMRFPIQDYARRFVEFRKQAQQEFGKGSGLDRAYKEQANTMYGVLATEHLPTQNFVAANYITAMARANAWMMAMVLNAVQTITDGVTYRRDQIPACNFAHCLQRKPDYPLLRPDGGEIPFLSPDRIPEDDAGFTTWLRERAKWFFHASGADFDKLVAQPMMEHKMIESTGSPAFDALACDGSGNYLKCLVTEDGVQIGDVKMRGFGPKYRGPILDWILATYPHDRIEGLCPIVEDVDLLKLTPAIQAAKRAIRAGHPVVYLPLGLPIRKPRLFKAIKLSAFILRTPSQHRKLSRQEARFVGKTGCGLEVLCLRQRYGREQSLGLSELASRLYDYIREDGQDLTQEFNLNRLSRRLADEVRASEIIELRRAANADLAQMIDIKNLSDEARKTGIYVNARSPLLSDR